jgi:Tetratricopeptide repeat
MRARGGQGRFAALNGGSTTLWQLTQIYMLGLGLLYTAQGRLKKAEAMCQRALEGYEKALRLGYTSTLNMVNNLGVFRKAHERLVLNNMSSWYKATEKSRYRKH